MPDSFLRIATEFPEAIASLELQDHLLALTTLFDRHAIAYEVIGRKVTVRQGGRLVLLAAFDELNRLAEWDVTLNPPPSPEPSSAETWEEGQLRRTLR